MIRKISQSLYADSPDERLYHYTTIKGLQGIIESRCLWASDVRYMNDSAELKYIVRLFRERVQQSDHNVDFLYQFVDWIENRITNGHMVFAASFRANGNLLSQWRGYSSIGKGVSIGFKGKDIQALAGLSRFQLGRCIYQKQQQVAIIDEVIQSLLEMAGEHSENSLHQSQEYIFGLIEADMLRIAALFKHPSFAEEDEWRIVSPVITDYLSAPVKFRESTAMLIPYYEFPLVKENTIPLKHVFIGPTPNSTLSLNSIRLYLRKHNIVLENEISYCDIPYRNR
jgi:hypothetical protein